MADFWDKYQEATQATDVLTKLRGLTDCFTQSEDKSVKRLAAHDLGLLLYQGKDGFPQDKEKGKKLMMAAADMGYGPAMNLYGQMLTHEGDTEAITYFCMALDEGEIMAAKNLYDLYAACSKEGTDNTICRAIDAGVGEVARIQREDKPEDENGKSSLVLALIGLYGLGGKCGISPAMGEEYLQKAAAKGNGIADTMIRNPELKGPATAMSFNPYKKNDTNDVNDFKSEKAEAPKSAPVVDSAPAVGEVVDDAPAKKKMTTGKIVGISFLISLALGLIGLPMIITWPIIGFVMYKKNK